MSKKMKRRVKNVVYYIVGTLVALIFVAPMIWMLVSSLKNEPDIFKNLSSLSTFIPKSITLENFQSVFERTPMLRFIFNSLFYCLAIVILDLLVNSMFGYALAKFQFKGREILTNCVVALMVFPFEAIILALYVEINSFGWLNSWLALIVPFIGKCFTIYLFRQFFVDFPDELLEAARIDGCGPFRIFIKIVIPNSGPVFATAFILDFSAHWNDYLWPLLVSTNEEMRTIQLGIATFFNTEPIEYGPIMAALVICTIPMLILFLILQKYYVQGITSSGIKG
ncbi:carbohydrate ABC transporter permease [Mediterraneibacter sp. NSJ-55]|uniref:Carbohydrate ABC transporter permease n=1 Tax=Mediterraneibacter hominis TaxID=2763054 RepID=A0A923LKF2_9FIRM|nr:carbohydrate ABC transporter permease [Mediterraneibacter hominis]MBC5689915.1 carbohydrate ABC transporter permease [Mediterraneibacter hominis]